jgi:uncharacterized membrane-anchored protein
MLGYILVGFVVLVFLSIIIGVSMMIHDYYVHERRAEENLNDDQYNKVVMSPMEEDHYPTLEDRKDE